VSVVVRPPGTGSANPHRWIHTRSSRGARYCVMVRPVTTLPSANTPRWLAVLAAREELERTYSKVIGENTLMLASCRTYSVSPLPICISRISMNSPGPLPRPPSVRMNAPPESKTAIRKPSMRTLGGLAARGFCARYRARDQHARECHEIMGGHSAAKVVRRLSNCERHVGRAPINHQRLAATPP